MAAWWSIIFFAACGVGYLTLMCIIGFFSEHPPRRMSRGKNTIMPHYVNIASGSFFWRGFLLRGVGALVYFFANTFLKTFVFHLQKNKVVQVCELAKTMT